MSGEHSTIPQVKLWYPRAIVYNPLKAGSIDGTDLVPHDKAVVRAVNASYKPNYKVKGDPSNTIFVARLSSKTTRQTLKHEFSKYGKITHCRVVKDVITNLSRRYAFVEFKKEKYAIEAVRRSDNLIVDGRAVLVEHECERLLPGWVPRRLGGGFGGRKESGQLRFGGKDKPFIKPIKLMDEVELRNQYQIKKTRPHVRENR